MGETTSPEDETPGEGTPAAGETPPGGEPADETAQFEPEDESAQLTPEDETTRLTPEDLRRPATEPGGTSVMPTGTEAPAWSGRAGVPAAPGGLRDSAPYTSPYQPAEPPPPRTWWTPALLGLVALGLVGIVLLAAFMISRQPRPEPQPTPTSTPAPQPNRTTAPATTGPPASASVQLVQVPPGLVGMSQDDATALLDKVGLSYSLDFQESNKPKGTVIASSPGPGKLVPQFSVVKLLVSLGGPSPSATATSTP